MLGDVHGEAKRDPHIARRIAGREGVGRGQPELIQDDVAHEGAAEVLAELGADGKGEFGVLHPFSVTALTQPVEDGNRTLFTQVMSPVSARGGKHYSFSGRPSALEFRGFEAFPANAITMMMIPTIATPKRMSA